MNNLSTRYTTTSNLNSKDDRKKRRAVRALFELDDENNLSSFIPLLDDKDSWYRSKALDAFRMWSVRLDVSHLEPLINHANIDYNRAAANLLDRFNIEKIEVVKQLFEKDDFICKSKSAEFILQSDNQQVFFRDLLHSGNVRLKLIALNSQYCTQEILTESLNDDSISIVNFSLNRLLQSGYKVKENQLMKLINRGVDFSNLAQYLFEHNPRKLIEQLDNLNNTELRIVVKILRQHCKTLDDEIIKILIENKANVILGRWLQGKKGDAVDKLRWEIIANEEVDEIERSRLIERLFSRCDEEEIRAMAKIIAEKSTSELISVTAHNLSTANDEAKP